MKMPGNCPICNGVMLNEYDSFQNGMTRITKTCLQVGHNIKFMSLCLNHDKVDLIVSTFQPGLTAHWFMSTSNLILRGARSDLQLPFFEPNLKSYNKLVNKLKTLMVFS